MEDLLHSRQFAQYLLRHSTVGKERDPEMIKSNLGEEHPHYTGDNAVYPHMKETYSTFDRRAGAWGVHKEASRAPFPLSLQNFGSTMFRQAPQFNIPKSYKGPARMMKKNQQQDDEEEE